MHALSAAGWALAEAVRQARATLLHALSVRHYPDRAVRQLARQNARTAIVMLRDLRGRA